VIYTTEMSHIKILIIVFKMLDNHYPLLVVDCGHVCSVSLYGVVLKVLLQQMMMMMMCCDLMSTEGCRESLWVEDTRDSTWGKCICVNNRWLWTYITLAVHNGLHTVNFSAAPKHQTKSMLPWQYTVVSFIIEILWNNSLWSKYKTGTHKWT